jgi:hypothetical protein
MNPETFWQQVESLIKPVAETHLEYRWYYDTQGDITACSMCDHPESGDYVIVDEKIYDQYYNYVIIRGVPVKAESDAGYRVRLIKSTSGYPVVAGHAALIIEPTETYTNTEYYAHRNH